MFPFHTAPANAHNYATYEPATTRGIATPLGANLGQATAQMRNFAAPTAAFSNARGAYSVGVDGGPAKNSLQAAVGGKAMRDLEHQAKTLTREIETAREDAAHARDEMRRLRGSLDARERELRLAKRALVLAHEERTAAEAAVGNDKAYARKLEARLAASGGGAVLREKHRQLRKQHASTCEEKETQAAHLAAAENAVVEANREVATLRSALRIKSQELVAAPPGATLPRDMYGNVGAAPSTTSSEVTERLLYAVARSREESVVLAVQLSERSQEVQNLKLELTTRVSELDEARLAREATSREILALERKLAEMSGSSARNENDATILRTQLDAASKRAESSGQEVLRLREAVEEARNALSTEKERNITHVAELQESHASAKRALDRELSESRREIDRMRTNNSGEMAALRATCDELRLEALELKAKLARDTEGLEAVLTDERRRRGELEHRFQSTMEAEASALSDAANAGAEADSLREANAILYDQNAKLREHVAQLQGKLTATRAEVSQMTERMGSSAELHKHTERGFQTKAESAISELNMVAEERDRLRVALHESLARCDALTAEREGVRSENTRLGSLVTSLQDAKTMLQDAMASRNMRTQIAVSEAPLPPRHPMPTASVVSQQPPPRVSDSGPKLAEAWAPPPPPQSNPLPRAQAPEVQASDHTVADMLQRLATASTAEELENIGLVSPPSEPEM